MIKDKLIDVYAEMDLEDKEFMIRLLAKDMFVPVEVDYKDGGKTIAYCMELDKENPVCFNGAMLQINLEEPIIINKNGDK